MMHTPDNSGTRRTPTRRYMDPTTVSLHQNATAVSNGWTQPRHARPSTPTNVRTLSPAARRALTPRARAQVGGTATPTQQRMPGGYSVAPGGLATPVTPPPGSHTPGTGAWSAVQLQNTPHVVAPGGTPSSSSAAATPMTPTSRNPYAHHPAQAPPAGYAQSPHVHRPATAGVPPGSPGVGMYREPVPVVRRQNSPAMRGSSSKQTAVSGSVSGTSGYAPTGTSAASGSSGTQSHRLVGAGAPSTPTNAMSRIPGRSPRRSPLPRAMSPKDRARSPLVTGGASSYRAPGGGTIRPASPAQYKKQQSAAAAGGHSSHHGSSGNNGPSAAFAQQQQREREQQQQVAAGYSAASNNAAGSSGNNGPPTTARAALRVFADSWASRSSENTRAYGEGGYMNVYPGDVFNGRYEIVTKLGWGEFSTVWLAYDRQHTVARRSFIALKIAKCRADVAKGTKYECCLLSYIRETRSRRMPIAILLDVFEHRGPYGGHLCMSMPLLGPNLLCVIDQIKSKRRRRSPAEVQMFKDITAAVLQCLEYLESVHILHTDIKPENVLCTHPDVRMIGRIAQFAASTRHVDQRAATTIGQEDADMPMATLADFGLSLLLETSGTASHPGAQRVLQHKSLQIRKPGVLSNDRGMLIQTREYRAPEVLFGTDFNCRTDIWSVGCMTYELITGEFLMDPKRKTRVEPEMDVEHVAMMMQLLGPVPQRVAAGSAATGNAGRHLHKYFDETGKFRQADKYKHYPRRSIAQELEQFLEPSEAERAAQFIMSCFTYDPFERCHAGDLRRHSWLRALTV